MKLNDSNIINIAFCKSQYRNSILSAINVRDITRNMVKVRSSNVWAYCINIRKLGDKVGDVFVQFKGSKGGPDDIYMYFDVPVIVYRKWISAPSKGHYFWVNIRNKYKYAKLTGDKKTKLANGIDKSVAQKRLQSANTDDSTKSDTKQPEQPEDNLSDK